MIKGNFYKIKKIQFCTPKKDGFFRIHDIDHSTHIKIILDKNILTNNMLWPRVYTKYGSFMEDLGKFRYNIYYYSLDIIDFINYGAYNYMSNLKEGDYLFIEDEKSFIDNVYNKNKYQEELGKFLGDLKNPDLKLIELCTNMINN